MSDQWLNNLRGKMEDHELDVPDGLWDEVREELFAEEGNNKVGLIGMDSAVENDRIRSNKPWLYRICGIAAAVVLFFFVGRELLDTNTHTIHSQKIAVAKKESEKKIGNTQDQTLSANEHSYPDMYLNSSPLNYTVESDALNKNITKEIFENKIISTTEIYQNTKIEIQKKEELLRQETQRASCQTSINELEKVSTEENTHDETSFLKKENNQQEKYADTDKLKSVKRHPKESWMLSMLTGNASRNSAEQQFPGYATINGSPMRIDEIFSSSSSHEDPLMEILMANQNKEVEARLRHKIPVTLGVSLYYNLGKKWGIGTGLNYTKLSSELHSGSNSNYIKGEQSVHYIGIPVQINYNVVQIGRFTGYITGGALVEKAVAGNLKTKYIVDDEVKEVSEKELDMKPLQFSVNTAVGLQVKIIDKFGIYAEPGFGYHFKDNTSLNTIYKEKPLNFNLKFGIRLLID